MLETLYDVLRPIISLVAPPPVTFPRTTYGDPSYLPSCPSKAPNSAADTRGRTLLAARAATAAWNTAIAADCSTCRDEQIDNQLFILAVLDAVIETHSQRAQLLQRLSFAHWDQRVLEVIDEVHALAAAEIAPTTAPPLVEVRNVCRKIMHRLYDGSVGTYPGPRPVLDLGRVLGRFDPTPDCPSAHANSPSPLVMSPQSQSQSVHSPGSSGAWNSDCSDEEDVDENMEDDGLGEDIAERAEDRLSLSSHSHTHGPTGSGPTGPVQGAYLADYCAPRSPPTRQEEERTRTPTPTQTPHPQPHPLLKHAHLGLLSPTPSLSSGLASPTTSVAAQVAAQVAALLLPELLSLAASGELFASQPNLNPAVSVPKLDAPTPLPVPLPTETVNVELDEDAIGNADADTENMADAATNAMGNAARRVTVVLGRGQAAARTKERKRNGAGPKQQPNVVVKRREKGKKWRGKKRRLGASKAGKAGRK